MEYTIDKPIFKEYILKKPIGEGVHGRVYLVENRVEQQFALKVFHRDCPTEKRVLEAMMKIRSNRLCNILDFGETTSGRFCILMEYFRESLASVFEMGKPGEKTAVKYFREILEGLKVLRDNGIVHKDIKPSNLFLDGIVKVGDFGTEKYTSGDMSAETRTGDALRCSAPECIKAGDDDLADLWAAAVIFYRMLAGRFPFDGESREEIIGAIIGQDPDYSPVSEIYREFFRHCFEKDPGGRFQSVEKMLVEPRDLESRCGIPYKPEKSGSRRVIVAGFLAFFAIAVYILVPRITNHMNNGGNYTVPKGPAPVSNGDEKTNRTVSSGESGRVLENEEKSLEKKTETPPGKPADEKAENKESPETAEKETKGETAKTATARKEPGPDEKPTIAKQTPKREEMADIGGGRTAYKVKGGDTFYSICKKVLGTSASWREEAKRMGIDVKRIKPGDVLIFETKSVGKPAKTMPHKAPTLVKRTSEPKSPAEIKKQVKSLKRGEIADLGGGRTAYKVKRRDTFSAICKKVLGTGASWRKEAKRMGIDIKRIRPGDVLIFEMKSEN